MPSSNFLNGRSNAVLLLWILFCYLCFVFVFVLLSCLSLAALWPSTGKGLASWLSCVCCFLVFLLLFHICVLDQVWYLIVSIPDICLLPYLKSQSTIFQSCYDSSQRDGERKEEWDHPNLNQVKHISSCQQAKYTMRHRFSNFHLIFKMQTLMKMKWNKIFNQPIL